MVGEREGEEEEEEGVGEGERYYRAVEGWGFQCAQHVQHCANFLMSAKSKIGLALCDHSVNFGSILCKLWCYIQSSALGRCLV